jgi:hypothetical protein
MAQVPPFTLPEGQLEYVIGNHLLSAADAAALDAHEVAITQAPAATPSPTTPAVESKCTVLSAVQEAQLILDTEDSELRRMLIQDASAQVRECLTGLIAHRELCTPTVLQGRVAALLDELEGADSETQRSRLGASDAEVRTALADHLWWRTAGHEAALTRYMLGAGIQH